MKIRSLQRNKDAKIYKVDKKRTKYQGKDLIVYNLFILRTKSFNQSKPLWVGYDERCLLNTC